MQGSFKIEISPFCISLNDLSKIISIYPTSTKYNHHHIPNLSNDKAWNSYIILEMYYNMITDIKDTSKERLADMGINMLDSATRQMSGAWLVGNILHVIY